MIKVLLLSGGMDSQLLAETIPDIDKYIYFDYGQENKEKELSKIKKPIEVIKIDKMKNNKGFFQARNLKFILKIREMFEDDLIIYFGSTGADFFPDNTLNFMLKLEDILNLSYENKTRIICPLKDKNKTEIYKELKQKNIDYWYCDTNQDHPCGVCHSCKAVRGVE